MIGMWAVFVMLIAIDQVDGIWGWVHGLPLFAELILWLALFPWLLRAAIWTESWATSLRVILVLGFAFAWSLASIPRRKRPEERGSFASGAQNASGR
jgi:hypothetical protein